MSGPEDEFRVLLKRAQDGSQDATCELIDSYGPHIVRAVRRKLNKAIRAKFDSIDFVQAVWASFFAAPKPLTDFRSPGELVKFLAALAQNKVVDEIRRRMETDKYNVNRERSLDDSAWEMHEHCPAAQPSPSELAVAEELWRRMLRGKSEHHRRILQLRREGNTHRQIADQLHMNERTVRRVIKSVFPESD
jgi:RNA polymerase sigma-70 factor (ECF subfamily)